MGKESRFNWKMYDEDDAVKKEESSKKDIKRSLKIAGIACGSIFVTGVIVGIGAKIGYDKIFETVVKNPKLINGPMGDNAIKFIVEGSNVFGKTIIQSKGVISIEDWVSSFVGSMSDKDVGSAVSAEFLNQANAIGNVLAKHAPELLEKAGITVNEF